MNWTAQEKLRRSLPYDKWIWSDPATGTYVETIFNRRYQPIATRVAGVLVPPRDPPANPWPVAGRYYGGRYINTGYPWESAAVARRCREILREWGISDALCRLATGGGFATRQLYENTDEVLFRGMRPLILDGIESFVERADLADRAIQLTLNAVSEGKRRGERELEREFAEKHPAILGALLNAVSHGLAELPRTRLDTLPRMPKVRKVPKLPYYDFLYPPYLLRDSR